MTLIEFFAGLLFLLFLSIPTIIGFAIIYGGGRVAILKCHRTPSSGIYCELRKAGLFFRTVEEIRHLQGAELDYHSNPVTDHVNDHDGEKTISYGEGYQIILITNEERIPMIDVHVTHIHYLFTMICKTIKINKINKFVKDKNQQKLKIKEDHRLISYLIGLPLIALGLFLSYGVIKEPLMTIIKPITELVN